jgi:hypothetical protein
MLLEEASTMAVKVMVAPVIAKAAAPKPARKAPQKEAAPRPKRRRSSVFDADGNEVLITLICLKCQKIRPLSQFGLRKMADGSIRNQPWCRSCRSGPSSRADKEPVETRVETPPAVESPVPEESPAAAPSSRSSVAAEVAAALAAGRG